MYLQIECKHCHSLVSPTQLNLATMQVECNRCKHTFPFTEQLTVNLRRKASIPKPDGMTILKKERRLNITFPWQKTLRVPFASPKLMIGLFTGLTLLGVLFLLAFMTTIPLALVLGVGFFILIGWAYYFFYRPLVFTRNHIHMEVDQQSLNIRFGPLPNPFQYQKIHLPVDEIQQLYIRRSKSRQGTPTPKSARYYALCVVLKDRKKKVLLEYLASPAIALFLEQEIEHFLHISDEPVAGEIEW